MILVKGECNCLANCDDDNYYQDEIVRKKSIQNISELRWSIRNYPNMRLKRDIIFGFTDLLGNIKHTTPIEKHFFRFSVNLGGMVGFFLGCSILSFVEILYFFTLRLYWHNKKGINRIKK